MIRALRVLKLTFAAALAMTAVTAPTAQANLFEAETYGPIFTFEHTPAHQLTVAGIPITCEHITFNNAGLSKAQTAFTVNGSYKKCKAKFGLAEKDITVTGLGDNSEKDWCVFELDAHGTLDLTCTGKAEVIFHSEICTVHIPPQKDIESLTYKTKDLAIRVT